MAQANFVEEWKTSVEVSTKFDEILVDIRKYGFTLITGLLTAGSFLGFTVGGDSILNQLAYANILHIGVIIVTMFLVVVLFWLDLYYQNLLYGSVIRTRFLELIRLRHRLSVYISGIYTGSSMKIMLYSIYAGFLLGCFFLGNIVADITAQSTSTITSTSASTMTPLNQSVSTEEQQQLQSLSITEILSDYIQSTRGVLTLSFGLSGIGMIAMAVVCIISRDKRIRNIDRILRDNRPTTILPLTEERIVQLEEQILREFPFKT